DVAQAARLSLAIASQPVTPSAVEIEAPSARLLIRFETTERAAEQMAATSRAMLHEGGASTDVIVGEAEQEIWKHHQSSIWEQPGLVAKVSVLPTDVESCLGMFAGSGSRLDWCAIGRAALGVLLVRMNATGDDQGALLGRLRQHVADKDGTVMVLRASNGVVAPVLNRNTDRGSRAVMAAV